MFYESLIILNISTLNFSEGVLASVLVKSPEKTAHVLFNTVQADHNWTSFFFEVDSLHSHLEIFLKFV